MGQQYIYDIYKRQCLNSACFKSISSCEKFEITVLFNDMRTLKFKGQPTNAIFSAVNQMFGGSSQLTTTTAEHCFIVWTVHNDLITVPSTVFGSWEEPPNI